MTEPKINLVRKGVRLYMSYSNDLCRELDDYLEEHSIAELLETVMYAIKYKEEELIEAANSNDEE